MRGRSWRRWPPRISTVPSIPTPVACWRRCPRSAKPRIGCRPWCMIQAGWTRRECRERGWVVIEAGAIEVRDLVVRFAPDAPPAVRGISFAVPRGTTFGLVGESGCGKSTVLRAIAGLNRTHEGEIFLDGGLLQPRRTHEFFRRV